MLVKLLEDFAVAFPCSLPVFFLESCFAERLFLAAELSFPGSPQRRLFLGCCWYYLFQQVSSALSNPEQLLLCMPACLVNRLKSLLFREPRSSSSGLPLKDYRKENVLPKIEIPVCWAWRLCSCVSSGRGLLGKCFNSLALERLFTCWCKISTRKTFSWRLWSQVAEAGTDKYSRRSVLPLQPPRNAMAKDNSAQL